MLPKKFKIKFLTNGRKKRGQIQFFFSKRQKLVTGVLALSLGLFFSEHFLGKSGLFLLIFLSILTDVFFIFAVFDDFRENMTGAFLILPFFYSLSFGLFYFLVPSRFLSRIAITSLYAIGLYSLFLSQNIFAVSSIRTIALLSSARIVSFVLTLISYFFLSNIIFSLHTTVIVTSFLIFVVSFFLILHSLWTYNLEKGVLHTSLWAFALGIALFELSLVLWFWPSNPTVIALFLTGFFYTIVSLSHVWFDRRLFRGVLWEYIWVSVAVLFVLILITSWR